MNINIRDIISKIQIRRKDKNAHTSEETQSGTIYTVWLLMLPLISGLVLGYLADTGMSYALDSLSGNAGMTATSSSGTRTSGDTGTSRRTLDDFLSENPFRISPLKPVVAEAPKPQEAPEQPQPTDTTIEKLILRGTMPGIGIWYEMDGALNILAVGKNIGRYRLMSVTYRDATFRNGRERITKYITYGPVAEAPKPEPPKAPATSRSSSRNNNSDQIVAAGDSQEGQISSEMVNQLIQNPFDELKRVRFRPSEKAGGLEVQWIQNDSILKRLGVQKGDVIRSVNGIPFTNMGDIANSISSLMNSERFDVEVTRGGKSTPLRYVVK